MRHNNSISWRVQLGFVALGYGAVVLVAAALLFGRHLQELQYPAEASGGMWAAGDMFLWIFIAGLFMLPTGFLILVTAKFETFYTAYSKFLLGLSLSAPVCLAVFYLGEKHVGEGLINLCLFRLVWAPFILLGMAISRLAARFDRAKKFASYALLVEGLTFAAAIALLIHAVGAHNNN
jgi:hypothetical protein